MNSRMTNGRASVAIIAFVAIALAAYGAWRLALGCNPELVGSLNQATSDAAAPEATAAAPAWV